MSSCALVTLEMEADARARARFEEKLTREHWTRLTILAWHRSFDSNINESMALVLAKADLTAAARDAGISVKCWIQISTNLPVVIEVGAEQLQPQP